MSCLSSTRDTHRCLSLARCYGSCSCSWSFPSGPSLCAVLCVRRSAMFAAVVHHGSCSRDVAPVPRWEISSYLDQSSLHSACFTHVVVVLAAEHFLLAVPRSLNQAHIVWSAMILRLVWRQTVPAAALTAGVLQCRTRTADGQPNRNITGDRVFDTRTT